MGFWTGEKMNLRSALKDVTFAGGTPNAIGDYDGTGNPVTLFTVTGRVRCKLRAVCTTTLTIDATATVEVGISGNTAVFIAQTAGDAPDANEIWHDASPDNATELESVNAERILANGQDILLTVATANVLTGVIRFYCEWTPISSDGNVVAA